MGKSFLDKGNNPKALSYLNIAAEIQLDQIGKVSDETQKYIEECKKVKK
jgi:hypothetical protein